MLRYRKRPLVLLLGDLALFYFALWLTLFIRNVTVPDIGLFSRHAAPFTLLFAVWLLVFFIAGLYDQHSRVFRTALPRRIMTAQVVNIFIAVLFFFFVPVSIFEITPKTNLGIYLIVSSLFILAWRLYLVQGVLGTKKHRALLLGDTEEMRELYGEINQHVTSPIYCTEVIDLHAIPDIGEFQRRVMTDVVAGRVTFIIADFRDPHFEPLLPLFYNLNFLRADFQCVDVRTAYEDILGRVPLFYLNYDWFLEHVSTAPRLGYDIFKRVMDGVLASILGVITLPLYPLVAAAVKIDDGGPVFFSGERVGKGNVPFTITKFRSMSTDGTGRVTRVGGFLRKTRIDELPQLWSVITGAQSLIGPRPEIPHLVAHYAEMIPYYNVRHLITPGLSGWGQISDFDVPRYEADVEKTKRKLSYDLYYIKHRSPFLDLHIALKTIWAMLVRSGT